MKTKQILLICGGGGSEHEVSLVSAQYFASQLAQIQNLSVHQVIIEKNGTRVDSNGKEVKLQKGGILTNSKGEDIFLHFAIPVFHGSPGETGEIQSVFELMGLPYFGNNPEASLLCFNKVSTKLWMDALGIKNTPYVFLNDQSKKEMIKAQEFFNEHGDVFVKASSQGSSIGAYHVTSAQQLDKKIEDAFKLSPYVLIEKTLVGRELELSAYEYEGKIYVSDPGEIICSDDFYSYEQKYSTESKTQTKVKAEGLTLEQIQEMKDAALKLFRGLKLRHLVRVDFFLAANKIYLNEPNTFPGHTPISMFPTMLEGNGHLYKDFLEKIILANHRKDL